jgi:hypothetical protein
VFLEIRSHDFLANKKIDRGDAYDMQLPTGMLPLEQAAE